MKISAKTDPRIICERWNEKIKLADVLTKTIQNGSLRGHSIVTPLEKLEKVRKKLKEIHHAAVLKAKYESTGLAKVRRFISLGGGVVLDGALQATTAALWSKVLEEKEIDPQNSILVAGVTLASLVASKIKDKISDNNRKYFEAISEMEGIIPSKQMIKHYKVVVTKYKGGACEGSSAMFAPQEDKPKEKALVAKNRFATAAQKVIESRAKEKLQGKYIVKLCGIYPRIDSSSVLELTESFKELKKLIIIEEDLIEDDLHEDPNADVMALIDQLDEQAQRLREIISDAEFLIAFNEQLKNTRSKYIASKFRLSLQFFIELGSLAGSITEAIYANLGSSSSAAKVSGLSLYVINIALSWINTAFLRVEHVDVDTLQNLRRIEAQTAFVKDVTTLVERVRKERFKPLGRVCVEGEDLEEGVSLMDRPPILSTPISPLQVKINALFEKTVRRKARRGKPTSFSIDELLVPARKFSKLKFLELPSHDPSTGYEEEKGKDEKNAELAEVRIDIQSDIDGHSYPVLDDILFA
jgi:ribosomal protein L22